MHIFASDADCTVVVFIGWECPIVRQYVRRLHALKREFENNDKQVNWITISSNQHDSLAELQHFSQAFKLKIPVLKDPGNKVADLFRATRTPEAFLLDKNQTIVYQGRIDDQFTYGRQRPEPKNRFLADAITNLLDDKKISTPHTAAQGCLIGRVFRNSDNRQTAKVTYSNQISRILQKNCVFVSS